KRIRSRGLIRLNHENEIESGTANYRRGDANREGGDVDVRRPIRHDRIGGEWLGNQDAGCGTGEASGNSSGEETGGILDGDLQVIALIWVSDSITIASLNLDGKRLQSGGVKRFNNSTGGIAIGRTRAYAHAALGEGAPNLVHVGAGIINLVSQEDRIARL